MFGIPHNAWYRGSPEGIGAAELSALLPLRKKLSWRVLTNVVMQGSLQKTRSSDAHKAVAGKLRFPKPAFVRLLRGLRTWIASLHPADRQPTTWQEYARQNSYRGTEAEAKRNFVARFVSDSKARTVWDIGCNTGDYSVGRVAGRRTFRDRLRLRSGLARSGVRSRAIRAAWPSLPLFLDVTNPAPDQGWGQAERRGLQSACQGRRSARARVDSSRRDCEERAARRRRVVAHRHGAARRHRVRAQDRSDGGRAAADCARTFSRTTTKRTSSAACSSGRASWPARRSRRPGVRCSPSSALGAPLLRKRWKRMQKYLESAHLGGVGAERLEQPIVQRVAAAVARSPDFSLNRLYYVSDAASPRLRIGVMVDHARPLPLFMRKVLEDVRSCNFATLECVIENCEAPARLQTRPAMPIRAAKVLLDPERRRSLLHDAYVQRLNKKQRAARSTQRPPWIAATCSRTCIASRSCRCASVSCIAFRRKRSTRSGRSTWT